MRAKFLILLLALACRAVCAGEWTLCVDDYKSDMLDVRALLAGRTNVIATYAESADLLTAMPDLSGRLVRMGPPFAHLPYFVAFGKGTYQARHDEIEALWRQIADMRRGEGYAGSGLR